MQTKACEIFYLATSIPVALHRSRVLPVNCLSIPSLMVLTTTC